MCRTFYYVLSVCLSLSLSLSLQEYIQPTQTQPTYCVGLLQMTALAAYNGPLAPGANHYHHATPPLLLAAINGWGK